MNVIEFDFEKVSRLKGKSVDELIDSLTLKQIERGNEKLSNDKGN